MNASSSGRVVAVVQARMGSVRLPGKVLMDIAGHPMLHHTLARLRRCRRLQGIVVATPEGEVNGPLRRFVEQEGVSCYAGDEHDVLRRMLDAAERAGAVHVVRITGDCPLIDPLMVDEAIKLHSGQSADYTYNFQARTFPRGLETEVIRLESLRQAHLRATEPEEREHVTVYVRRHAELFRHSSFEARKPLRRPCYRLCVDDPADLALIREIFAALYKNGRVFGTRSVIELLDRRPDLVAINAQVRQKEVP